MNPKTVYDKCNKKKDIQPESRKYAKLLQIWTSVSILLLVKVENLGPHLTQRF